MPHDVRTPDVVSRLASRQLTSSFRMGIKIGARLGRPGEGFRLLADFAANLGQCRRLRIWNN